MLSQSIEAIQGLFLGGWGEVPTKKEAGERERENPNLCMSVSKLDRSRIPSQVSAIPFLDTKKGKGVYA